MVTARYYHECARITRYGRDNIMVFGGQGASGLLNSIELYDLSVRPASWTVWTGVGFPVVIGNMLASVVMSFEDNYCNAMIISQSTNKILVCTDNHQWRQYGTKASNQMKKMTKIDANMF